MPQDWFSQYASTPAEQPEVTTLAPNDEKRFQSWYRGVAKRQDIDPDPDAPEHFYDYRGAFKAGATPDETGHWPSAFKREGHPRMVLDGVNTKTGARAEPTGGDDWFAQFDAGPTFRTENERDEHGQPVIADQERSTAADVAIGAAKGLGNTVVGLGEMVHRIPGVTRAVDALYGEEGLSDRAFKAGREAMQPTNTPQRVGFTAEQIGEFFVPGGSAAKLAQVPKAALTTLAQTGSPVEAGVSGAITAAIPGASAVQRGARALQEGAEKTFAQALGPTKEWAKSEARRIAPQAIERGVKGSREAMLQQARTQSAKLGEELNAVVAAAAEAGETVTAAGVRNALRTAKDGLLVTAENGKNIPIAGTEPIVKRLNDLTTFVEKLGDEIPIDKAMAVKRTWDHIVSKAGLYGPKAGSTATDSAQAWSLREASGAMRKLINSNPALADINKELSFWTGLKKVLTETEKRTQAQSGGLVSAGTGGAGAIVGAMQGESMGERTSNALIGGLAGRQLMRMLQSPSWRTSVSAPSKQLLADALASGQTGKILHAMGKISASLPSVAR